MPLAMSGYIQAVEAEGTVYVGGGDIAPDEGSDSVMAYNTQSSQWHILPPYIASRFSMAVVDNKLVLVGGHDGSKYCRGSGVWQTDSCQWTHPYPPMPTRRDRPSSASYKHWLVVAGGWNGSYYLSTVEILDVETKQWSNAPPLPKPCSSMKSTVIEDTWYLMGGNIGRRSGTEIYTVSLEALVERVDSENSKVWKELNPLNYVCSCPLGIGGCLLAFGGNERKHGKPSSILQRYIPEISAWVTTGRLPQPLHYCTCVNVSDKIYVYGRGQADNAVCMHYCRI